MEKNTITLYNVKVQPASTAGGSMYIPKAFFDNKMISRGEILPKVVIYQEDDSE